MGTPSPHDREYIYRHIWPILDDSRPISALKVEASAAIGPILGRIGVRPVGQPRYTVADDRLVCEVPVLRLDGDEPERKVDKVAVLRLLRVGWTDRHIAAELNYNPRQVWEIRQEAGLPPVGQQIGSRRPAGEREAEAA